VSKEKTLNPRHQEFIRQYFLCGRNASKAYKKTYPDSKNPDVDGSKLLVNPSIQAVIQEKELEIEVKFEITLERIIQEYATIAFGSIGNVLDWDGNDVKMKPKSDLTEEQIKFIDAVSFERTVETDYEGKLDAEGNYPEKPTTKLKVTTLAKEKTKALDSLVKLLGYDKLESGATSSTKALTEALAQLDLEKEGRA
jgi:phage terminase small subunit